MVPSGVTVEPAVSPEYHCMCVPKLKNSLPLNWEALPIVAVPARLRRHTHTSSFGGYPIHSRPQSPSSYHSYQGHGAPTLLPRGPRTQLFFLVCAAWESLWGCSQGDKNNKYGGVQVFPNLQSSQSWPQRISACFWHWGCQAYEDPHHPQAIRQVGLPHDCDYWHPRNLLGRLLYI